MLDIKHIGSSTASILLANSPLHSSAPAALRQLCGSSVGRTAAHRATTQNRCEPHAANSRENKEGFASSISLADSRCLSSQRTLTGWERPNHAAEVLG